MEDRAKRAVEWAAAERSAKKPCCHRDPSGGGGGGVPEISSLLSSLSVAKRRSPAAHDHDHAPLGKRPRYDHHHDLDARMRGTTHTSLSLTRTFRSRLLLFLLPSDPSSPALIRSTSSSVLPLDPWPGRDTP